MTKKTTKRKTTKRKKVSGAAAPSPDTISITGIGRYTRHSCGKTKADAKKTAEMQRATGKGARIRKSGTSWCVYTRGRAKSK